MVEKVNGVEVNREVRSTWVGRGTERRDMMQVRTVEVVPGHFQTTAGHGEWVRWSFDAETADKVHSGAGFWAVFQGWDNVVSDHRS